MRDLASIYSFLSLSARMGKIIANFCARLVVLQKMGRDIKGLARTPTYAAIMKRFDTNLTCPWMAPLPTPSICPFRIMFIAS